MAGGRTCSQPREGGLQGNICPPKKTCAKIKNFFVKKKIMETYVPVPYPGRLPSRLTKVYLKWLESRERSLSVGCSQVTPEEIQAKKEELWEEMCYDSWCEGQMKAMKEKGYTAAMGEKTSKYFVTINPKADTPIEPLVKTVDKWVKQKYIKTAQYVYEQGSDTIDKAGQHPHVHAIVEVDINKKSVLDRTANTFKNLIGDKASIDIKPAHANSMSYL